MAMTLTLFGPFKNLGVEGRLELPAVANTDELRRALEMRFPQVSGIPYLIAIDERIATGTQVIAPTQQIAILPPYSGG